MALQGKLKNEELLDFIDDDAYFKENIYESFAYRPLAFLEGIDLEIVGEKFYEKWHKVDIFKKFSFSKEAKAEKKILNKIIYMKDFGKLLRLFNFKNEKSYELEYDKLLSYKYESLIKTYSKESCPNFIQDTSTFLYILDKDSKTAENFMKNIIEKYFI